MDGELDLEQRNFSNCLVSRRVYLMDYVRVYGEKDILHFAVEYYIPIGFVDAYL
jgi:hypothetical protein